MRRFSFPILLGTLLCQTFVALADDPAPVSVKEGIVVSATGHSTLFNRHQLYVNYSRENSFEREKTYNALKLLGFVTETDISGFDPRNDPGYFAFDLPDGLCDGERLGKYSRKDFFTALERGGVTGSVFLTSTVSEPRMDEAERQALVNAVRSAREKAAAMAREGGLKLGKPLGIEQSKIASPPGVRNLQLDRNRVRPFLMGGISATVTVRFSVR